MIETKFQTTEFGLFPNDWIVKSLGELGEPLMCKRVMKEQTTTIGDVPFFKIGTFGKSADAFISFDLFKDFKARFSFPKKGDVLISAAGTIGRTVVYDGKPAYFQDSNIVWIDNSEKLLSNKLLHYIYSTVTWATDTTTISRLYNNHLKSTKIAFPSDKKEQEKISEALSDIDSLITELGELIEKKRSVLKGTMQELLTGKRRLEGFSGTWEEVTLNDICEQFRQSISASTIKPSKYISTENMIPDCNGISEYKGEISSEKVIEFFEGDILMSNIRPYLRKIYYSNFKGGCSTDVIVFRPKDKVNNRYLYYSLCNPAFSDFVMSSAVGSKMPRGDKRKMMDFKILLSKDKQEQESIAAILSDMDSEIAELEKKRDKYKAVREGMMQQLLTGKIRLI